MGYYVDLIDHNAYLPAESLDEAYRIMCELNDHNDIKGGGCYPRNEKDGAHDGIWFSWMEWNYPETCKNAEEIFVQLGFECDYLPNGGLFLCGYSSKIGDENVFLASLHDLWRPMDNNNYPFHAWRGEDGDMWCMAYDSNGCNYKKAVITWVSWTEYVDGVREDKSVFVDAEKPLGDIYG